MTIILIILISFLIGSFLNVCIYRIPRGESISYPRSYCPKCNVRLKPIDLIPVFSFMFYKGKCIYCGEKISLQYPFIEILNAIIYIIIYLKIGFTIDFIKYVILSSLLLIISIIDYKHKIIPDKLLIFGFFTGFIFILLSNFKSNSINGIIGLFIGGGIFLFIAIATNGAMGGGDIKLMAMLGLWLGWKKILIITFLSFIIGAIVSIMLLILKIKEMKDYIPFGPFISIAFFITFLFNNTILQFYFNTLFN